MIEARIDNAQLATEDDARTVLARFFPTAGVYLLKSPRGHVVEIALDGPIGSAEGALALWHRLIADPGIYMVKAAPPPRGGKPFDVWFYERLLDEASTRHRSFREVLRRFVADYIARAAGELHSPARLAEFEQLLFDMRTALRWSLAIPLPLEVAARATALGLTERDIFDLAGIAYRMGMIDEQLQRHPGWDWSQVMAAARQVPLTPVDEAAIAFARERVATYLTPVMLRGAGEVHLGALEREIQRTRGLAVAALRDNRSAREFASTLYHQLGLEDGVQRDWDRVARTELQDARLRGSFSAERALRAWTPETQLYRNLSATPCNGCLLLYRTAGGLPRLYTVREVEEADALGPNRGPWREWHARIGPTHPNCLDSPWQMWLPALTTVFGRRADAWRDTWKSRGLPQDADPAHA